MKKSIVLILVLFGLMTNTIVHACPTDQDDWVKILNYFRQGSRLPQVTTQEVFHGATFNNVNELTSFILNSPKTTEMDNGDFFLNDFRWEITSCLMNREWILNY